MSHFGQARSAKPQLVVGVTNTVAAASLARIQAFRYLVWPGLIILVMAAATQARCGGRPLPCTKAAISVRTRDSERHDEQRTVGSHRVM
jgi:hypothetical protein